MRVIVPGGYYSYDSAGKKIWLDYQYYGTTLENIERVKNLTRNKILYDCKRSTVLPTVSNGCITHSYQGTEADADKIQITLRTPIQDSLTELTPVDGVVTLETDGKVLVLPTSNAAILPSFNQSVLDPNRLTIAESPFGGLKGSGSPDYCVGTVNVIDSDGIYLTDINGQNSTKTLTAGKLSELGNLTVDTTNHVITEEFVIQNDSAGTDVQTTDMTSNWTSVYSTGGTINYSNGVVTLTDATTDSGGRAALVIVPGAGIFTGKTFLKFSIRSSVNANLLCLVLNLASSTYKTWSGSRFQLAANTWKTFVLPVLAPVGTTGSNPSNLYENGGTFDITQMGRIYFGVVDAGAGALVNIDVSDVQVCNGTWAQVEAAVPDNLSATSLSLYTHDGTAYQLCSSHSLDGAYSQLSQTSANCTFLDSTKLDDVFGVAGGGRAVFPKSSAGTTVNGSTGSITYSENRGTDKRIGLKFNLPPSDNGRTNFNKVRLKLVVNYTDTVGNVVPDLSGNNNNATVLGTARKLARGIYTNTLEGSLSSGRLTLGTNPAFVRDGSFTIYGRIKPITLKHGALMCQWTYGGNSGAAYQLYLNSGGGISLNIESGTTSDSISKSILPTGTEHFIAAGYDKENKQIKIVNNSLVATKSTTLTGINTPNTPVYIGGYSTNTLDSEIYEVCYVPRYLSDVEIEAARNGTVPLDATLYLNPTSVNMGSTTHNFANSTNTSYGLQNLSKPWIALYDPANSLIDFYLFTHRPQNLSFKRDETGTIYSLSLYPGAGSVYHGQITFADLTRDTNSDSVPDCLEAAVNGSVTKFLANYSMVI